MIVKHSTLTQAHKHTHTLTHTHIYIYIHTYIYIYIYIYIYTYIYIYIFKFAHPIILRDKQYNQLVFWMSPLSPPALRSPCIAGGLRSIEADADRGGLPADPAAEDVESLRGVVDVG